MFSSISYPNFNLSQSQEADIGVLKVDPQTGFVEFPTPGESKHYVFPLLIDPEDMTPNIENKDEQKENEVNDKLKSFWMPDKLCKVCYSCEDTFTMYRRRHHCRMCGQVFCNQCSSYYINGESVNTSGAVRSCRLCFEQIGNKFNNKELRKPSTRKKTLPNDMIRYRHETTPQPLINEIENNKVESVGETRYGSTIFGEDPHQNVYISSGIYESTEAKISHVSNLQNRASSHIEAVLNLLVRRSSYIPRAEKSSWHQVIVNLVREVVSNVDPDVRGGDQMDIRPYVKIKIIPGGSSDESAYIPGVVFRKNVCHRNMLQNKTRPNILLLAGGIEFERLDCPRMASLDTLLEQEVKYLEILVEKIMSLKPDIILVGKSVARRAQEVLSKYPVAVMQNIKPHLLERISRMTGAVTLASTDHMIQQYGKDCLGTCHHYWLRHVLDDPERSQTRNKMTEKPAIVKPKILRGSTYVYLEGCPVELGCSIVLRGADSHQLRAVKSILRFSVMLAYHLRLEVTYYSDRCMALASMNSLHPAHRFQLLHCNSDDDDLDDDAWHEQSSVSSYDHNTGKDGDKNAGATACPDELRTRSQRLLLSSSLEVDVGLPYLQELRGSTKPPPRSAYSRLSPMDHQTLLVSSILLTDNNSTISSGGGSSSSSLNGAKSQRTRAEIKGIRYYSQDDITLGEFLTDSCFYISGKRDSLVDHTLAFVHRPGRIDITVSRDISISTSNSSSSSSGSGSGSSSANMMDLTNKMNNEMDTYNTSSHTKLDSNSFNLDPLHTVIYLSTYCRSCQRVVTPEVIMSDESWKMSFGKFLEISFYCRSSLCRTGGCGHNIRDETVLRFHCSGFVASFVFVPIHPYSLHIRVHMPFPSNFHKLAAVKFLKELFSFSGILLDNFSRVANDLECLAKDSASMISADTLAIVTSDLLMLQSQFQQTTSGLTEELKRVEHILSQELLLESSGETPFQQGIPFSLRNTVGGSGDLMKSISSIQASLAAGSKICGEELEDDIITRNSTYDDATTIDNIAYSNDLAVPLTYPMAFKRELFLRAVSWNERLQSIYRCIEDHRSGSGQLGQGLAAVAVAVAVDAYSAVMSVGRDDSSSTINVEPVPTTATFPSQQLASMVTPSISTYLPTPSPPLFTSFSFAPSSIPPTALLSTNVSSSLPPLTTISLSGTATTTSLPGTPVAEDNPHIEVQLPDMTTTQSVTNFAETNAVLNGNESETADNPSTTSTSIHTQSATANDIRDDSEDHMRGAETSTSLSAIAREDIDLFPGRHVADEIHIVLSGAAAAAAAAADGRSPLPPIETNFSHHDNTVLASAASALSGGGGVQTPSSTTPTSGIEDSLKSSNNMSHKSAGMVVGDYSGRKGSRLTKAIARLLGKDSENELRYTVPLGVLGTGRLGMKPGRYGRVIAVHDEELGTIIAYSLSSEEYFMKLNDMSEHLQDPSNSGSNASTAMRNHQYNEYYDIRNNQNYLQQQQPHRNQGFSPVTSLQPLLSSQSDNMGYSDDSNKAAGELGQVAGSGSKDNNSNSSSYSHGPMTSFTSSSSAYSSTSFPFRNQRSSTDTLDIASSATNSFSPNDTNELSSLLSTTTTTTAINSATNATTGIVSNSSLSSELYSQPILLPHKVNSSSLLERPSSRSRSRSYSNIFEHEHDYTIGGTGDHNIDKKSEFQTPLVKQSQQPQDDDDDDDDDDFVAYSESCNTESNNNWILRLSKVDEEDDTEDAENTISIQQQEEQELRKLKIEELTRQNITLNESFRRQDQVANLIDTEDPVFGFQKINLSSSPTGPGSGSGSIAASTNTPKSRISPSSTSSSKGKYIYSPLSLGRSRTRSNTINMDDIEVKVLTENLDRHSFQSTSSNQSGKLTKTKSSDSILDRLILNFEKKNSDTNLFEDLTSPSTSTSKVVLPPPSLIPSPQPLYTSETRSQYRDHPLSFASDSDTSLGTDVSFLPHSTGTGEGIESIINSDLDSKSKGNSTTSTHASLSSLIPVDNEGRREDQDHPLRPSSSLLFHDKQQGQQQQQQQQLEYQHNESNPLNQRSNVKSTELLPEVTNNQYRFDNKSKRNGSATVPTGVGFDPLSAPSSQTAVKYPPADIHYSNIPQTSLNTNNSIHDGNSNSSTYTYQNNNEQAMLSQRKAHVKHRFSDMDEKNNTLCKFICHSFYATQFHALRVAYFGEEDTDENYVRSLSTSTKWNTEGGKSGAKFSKSEDGRLVVKQFTRTELQMFLDFAPAYFEYMSKVFYHNLPTVLCKILGVYQVGYHNKVTGKRVMEQVVVMENLFFERNVSLVFDLKGSTRSRLHPLHNGTGHTANGIENYPLEFDEALLKRRLNRKSPMATTASNNNSTTTTDMLSNVEAKPETSTGYTTNTNNATTGSTTSAMEDIRSPMVLLDDNLMHLTKGFPFPLRLKAKAFFQKAVMNDTLFLSIINVVDYSILVGIDDTNYEVVVGMIDFMRQYDIIKRMESMSKSVGMMVGKDEPTVIHTLQYRKRFQLAMEKYFMTVPDKWIPFATDT